MWTKCPSPTRRSYATTCSVKRQLARSSTDASAGGPSEKYSSSCTLSSAPQARRQRVRWVRPDDELGQRAWPAGRPSGELRQVAALSPRRKGAVQEDEAAAGSNEIRQPGRLAGLHRVIARRKENSRAVQGQLLRIGDHLDRELMRRLERPQQRTRHMQVVMPSARQQENDRNSIRHLGDFTMDGRSDSPQHRQRLFGRLVPREIGSAALAFIA